MAKEYLIAGNWKMNLNLHEASLLVHRLSQHIAVQRDVEVVLAPSFVHLQPLSMEIDRRKFRLAAQNAYHKDNGAFTGEVSFSMLHNLVHYVIVGHSERRLYFNESLETVRDKVDAALRNDISPIICVGETQVERRAGETKQVLHDQITTALSNLTSEDLDKVVIAYEPVWAISTFGGELAKPHDVKQAIDFIRLQIAELYGKKAASEVRVLYGGSVDDQIVRGYLEIDGCNGALVGGASLNHLKFAGIVNVAHALSRESHHES
jgi:triosephosphate isomerase